MNRPRRRGKWLQLETTTRPLAYVWTLYGTRPPDDWFTRARTPVVTALLRALVEGRTPFALLVAREDETRILNDPEPLQALGWVLTRDPDDPRQFHWDPAAGRILDAPAEGAIPFRTLFSASTAILDAEESPRFEEERDGFAARIRALPVPVMRMMAPLDEIDPFPFLRLKGFADSFARPPVPKGPDTLVGTLGPLIAKP